MEERYIATADLGTTKIGLSVARVQDRNTELLYYRETPSDGLRYSNVSNPRKAGDALKEAVKSAEDELGIKITQLVVGLPRYSITQVSATASLDRTEPDECIEQEEIDALKSIARDDYDDYDKEREEIYGVVPQSFDTDDTFNQPESEVIGAPSSKLKGNFKFFIGAKKSLKNLDMALTNAGVVCAKKVFLPAATAEAVLTDEEKDNGVALVEVGGGVTSLTIYKDNLLRYYHSIPFGARNVTRDIKSECGFKESLCENIKLAYGACMPENLQNMSEKIIQVNYDEDGTNKQIPVKYLSEVITARMKEIFEAVLYLIQDSGYADRLRAGIVITGGGAALTNASRLFGKMSGYNVRIGYPRYKNINIGGYSAICETSATATMGMLLRCKNNEHINCIIEIETDKNVEQEHEVEYIDTVFEQKQEEEKDSAKPVKPAKKQKVVWFTNLRKSAEKTVDKTIGTLFDGMTQ